MGGQIHVESQVGRGTTIRFTVRFETADRSDCQSFARLEELAGLPVAIVDDNSMNRQILEEMVTGWGMKPLRLAVRQRR